MLVAGHVCIDGQFCVEWFETGVRGHNWRTNLSS